MNTVKEVKEAIEILQEEIQEKQNQIEQLHHFCEIAQQGLTEQQYHDFCDTDLRHSDVLGKALLTVFPFLEYDKKSCNWFFYKAKEEQIQVCIPNSRCLGVDIVIPDLIVDLDKKIRSIEQNFLIRETSLRKEVEKLKSYLNAKTTAEQARVLYPNDKLPLAVFKLLMNYQTDAFVKTRFITKTDELELLLNHKQTKIQEVVAQYEEQQAFLNQYAEAFLSWTKLEVRVQQTLNSYTCLHYRYRNGALEIIQ